MLHLREVLSFEKRLGALRDRYLAALEMEVESRDRILKPTYGADGERYEWAEWRLRTVQAICAINRELRALTEEKR